MTKKRPFAGRPRRAHRLAFLAAGLLAVATAMQVAGPSSAAPERSAAAPQPGWIELKSTQTSHCGITTENRLWCKGNNSSGELGVGNYEPQDEFIEVGGFWASISPGRASWCGIRTDGRLSCWGANYSGQLGTGDTLYRVLPTLIGDSTWLSVDVGTEHACGVRSDHSLHCWGSNSDGQLGLGDTDDRLRPTQVTGSRAWDMVSTGLRSSCALYLNGTRFCWGDNDHGQLGLGNTTDRLRPTRLTVEDPWLTVRIGGDVACGIRRDHTMACWGWQRSRTPTNVKGEGWTDITFGDRVCYIRQGDAYCGEWGEEPTSVMPRMSALWIREYTDDDDGDDLACGVRRSRDFSSKGPDTAYCWLAAWRTEPQQIPVP